MIRNLTLLVLVITCLLPERILGQRHFFIPFSVNEGLAQSQVRDIVQSEDGFLWIATVGGISRFDGNSFKTYNKSNGLMNNLANALYQGEDGRMIASCVGGLAVFEGEMLTQYYFEEPFENALVNDFVGESDQLLLGTNGKGLLIFESGRIVDRIDLGSEGKNFIRCIKRTKQGILAGTKQGLVLIRDDRTVITLDDSISVNEIAGSAEEQWIATNGHGLYRYFKDSLYRFTKDEGLINKFVRDVCIDHRGNPWIISKNSIQRLDRENFQFEIVRSFDPEITSNMKVIYADKEHNIWIGTDGYGILKFTGEQFEIYSTDDGLSSNIIMDIDQEPDGDYVFATYGYGAIRKGPHSTDTIGNNQGLTNLTIWSILTRNEETWLGTSDGIQILKGTAVEPFQANADIPFPRISNLFQDSQNRIWIATRDGVCFWNGDSIVIPNSINRLNPKDSKGFAESDGNIWFTTNNGLIRFDQNGLSTRINTDNGLPENYLTCIAKGESNDLWLGSEEGVIHFSTESDSASIYRLSDRLSSNIINFIANENGKHLWLGTDNGLFSLDLIQFYQTGKAIFRSFNQHDGIISNECNQNAVFIDQAGDVWFGTNGGLMKYNHLNDDRNLSEVIGISISDIQQNFESVLQQVDVLSSNHEDNTFKYNESRLTFRYSAIHFTNPDKVIFSYRLIGLDQDWSPETKENYITYSNLSPGDYTFEIRAKISGGEWSTERSQFHFFIAPPFWMRWWFIALFMMALALTIYAIFKQYEKQKDRKRAYIDMRNRARILGLEQQTLNAHMNRHFIFNALNSIQYYINTQDRLQANQYLTNFASLVRKNLDSAQVESINLKDELERLSLYINLEQMRFKNRFEFDVKVDSDLDLDAIQVPSMILQPFVENSIMHGILPAENFGKIEIRIQSHPDGIKFTIDDNGIGIDTSVKFKNGTSHHVSNGMKITKQRIDLLAKAMNSAYGVFGPFELKGSDNATIGTRVEIVLPLNYQKFKQFYSRQTE